MRPAASLLAIGAALWVLSGPAQALGFGRVSNATQLGQPLDFSAAVNLDVDENLPRECVFAEVTSGENRLLPTQIRVALESPPQEGPRRVRVTTSALIDEPIVTVTLTLGCGAKVTRKFVAFIDPPSVSLARADSLPLPAAPAPRADSQVAPLLAIVQAEQRARPVAAPTAVPRAARPPRPARPTAQAPHPSARLVSAVDAPTASTTGRPRNAGKAAGAEHAAPPAGQGPRLQLDAPALALTASAPARAGALPSEAQVASAAASAAIAQVLAQATIETAEHQRRMQALEEGFAKLRVQSAATEQALAQLQLRLKTAEADRYANPLVYALAVLSALLAFAVAVLWWRQSAGRQGVQWWTAAPAAVAGHGDDALDAAALADAALIEVPADAWTATPTPVPAARAVSAADVSRVLQSETNAATDAVTRPAPFLATAVVLPTPTEPARELSVEELIDLEQQVEFFVVLGQDDAAIELLMSHVRSDGGTSPLPYLKLLEIYRRRGEVPAYERIRDRFNRRFNAYAPEWDADLLHGRLLADYPETVTGLQTIWADPVRVMDTLDASLFRRQPHGETFDLPAYRELLFLYSIARDLAEHDVGAHAAGDGGSTGVRGRNIGSKAGLPGAGSVGSNSVRVSPGGGAASTVDLLLPLGDDAAAAGPPIARLQATTPLDVELVADPLTQPLDLDVSFGPSSISGVETAPAAWRSVDSPGPAGFQDASHFIDFDLSEPAPLPAQAFRKR